MGAVPAAWFRYGYYLRFAAAGWVFFAVFPAVAFFLAPDLLSGLFVLSRPQCLVLGFVLGLSLKSLGALVGFVANHATAQFDLVFRRADGYEPCHLSLNGPAWIQNGKVRRLLHWMPAATIFAGVAVGTWLDALPGTRTSSTAIALTCCISGALAAHFLFGHVVGRFAPPVAHYLASQLPGRVQSGLPSLQLGAGKRAALLLLSWFLAYVVLQFFPAGSPLIASLTLLVVVVTWISWLLATLSFVLDRWLVPLALIALIVTLFPDQGRGDHVFSVRPQARCSRGATPPEALVAPSADGRPIVMVAAAGGGIQASAWTARVLRSITDGEPEFRERLRLISAVSGGSVGAMFYLNEEVGLHGVHARAAASCSQADSGSAAVRYAERAALDAVASGLAYRDIWRPLLSLAHPRSMVDRGFLLERAWARDCELCDWDLSRYRQLKEEHSLPEFVFNATSVETGRPVFLGTAEIPSRFDISLEHLSGWDLKVVTAARLSATFPFVTPAARPITESATAPTIDGKPVTYQIVDGGYYDNFGVSAVANVIEIGLMRRERDQQPLPKLIVLITIEPLSDTPDARAEDTFRSQTLAPVRTLLAVRNAAQRTRGQEEIDRMVYHWGRYGVNIAHVSATFPHSNGPLSWRLTRRDLQALRSEQACSKLLDLAQQVRSYLR